MKVAIVGSRTFNNYELVKTTMDYVKKNVGEPSIIVSGAARGADSLAEDYADEFNLEKMIFPALWDIYGKRAGFFRNTTIVENSDVVVAFWDYESNGTRDTISKATSSGCKIIIVNINTHEIEERN